MLARCHVCRVGQRCPASVALPWCRHSSVNAAFVHCLTGLMESTWHTRLVLGILSPPVNITCIVQSMGHSMSHQAPVQVTQGGSALGAWCKCSQTIPRLNTGSESSGGSVCPICEGRRGRRRPTRRRRAVGPNGRRFQREERHVSCQQCSTYPTSGS